MTITGKGTTIPKKICRILKEAKKQEEKASFLRKIELIAIAVSKNHLRVSQEIQEGINEFLGQTGSVTG